MYRINQLLKLKNELYHTSDLSYIWGIKNSNTLYTTIKRYVKRGILIPIHKGFYAVLPLNQIDPLKLGLGYIHQFAYVSCEYVLLKLGVIFQKSPNITFVSGFSKKFSVENNLYSVRKLKENYLYNNYEVVDRNGVMIANLERAVADLLYFNPHYYFDNRKMVNWDLVKKIQKEVGYE